MYVVSAATDGGYIISYSTQPPPSPTVAPVFYAVSDAVLMLRLPEMPERLLPLSGYESGVCGTVMAPATGTGCRVFSTAVEPKCRSRGESTSAQFPKPIHGRIPVRPAQALTIKTHHLTSAFPLSVYLFILYIFCTTG